MMIRKVLLGALVLILFSCGELPELKPVDWGSRLSFSGKPYTGAFDEWDKVDLEAVEKVDVGYAQQIKKSQRWKGSGKLTPGKRVYYILYAKNDVAITVDWRYREDDRIDFVYKRAGSEVRDYDFDDKQIPVAEKEYLVIRISLPEDVTEDLVADWELGFTVK
ncbi:MAG: hypothetical protein LBK61_14345 [Spirochaetaceae bacterium]|jgi:hypothetical protein|nr:hypothetical protein [Spirochaetaceae bacterium]